MMEKAANVLLRVPGLALLDLLYRWDVKSFPGLLRPQHPPLLQARHAWSVYYLGHVLCAVLLMLPVRYLVKMYLYILTLMLLYVAHQTARDYIRREVESAYHGAVYGDTVALHRALSALTGQVIVSTLCSLLMKTRQAWLFSAPMLPLMARLCGIPLQTLPLVNTFATILTSLEVLYVLVSNLFVPLKLAKTACREVAQVLEVYRFVALGMLLWNQLAVPLLFLIFWLVMYSLQVYFFLTSRGSGQLTQQGLVFVFLNSVAECCATPYSLIGLTFTVSYLALGLLNLCKFYLVGFSAFQNGNVMHRGVTEGVTLLLLALQTGLLDLQVLQRTFLLSIILFIVVTSTLQSMIEITDPIVLSLGASRNRSPWKHIRGLSMCLFLLIFPSFMAYKISRFFHMDFWLLILVSSCMLTSLQVMGTLFIYALFMVELFQDNPLEKMDEIIYYVNAVSRVLEFLVAVCVVGYGTWESIFGEWSWMGASVIIIHSYLNVWLRAQSGWKSFLLRREASKKINSLPKATQEQLLAHNDVCAICFQDMSISVITTCGHFFHASCLRKWLYVQDTCPMCHHQVNPLMQERNHGELQPMNEREEQAAAPRTNGCELEGANADAVSQEQEGSEPAGEKQEASTQGCEEPLPEGKNVCGVPQGVGSTHPASKGDCLMADRTIDQRTSALHTDSSSMLGVEPCRSGNEDMFDEDCFKSSQILSSIEQRLFLLSDIRENSPSCVNTGIPEEALSAAGDCLISIEDSAAHRLHKSQCFSKDNVQGLYSGQAETETKTPSSMGDTEGDHSEIRHRPEVFETEPSSSGPSFMDSGETDLHISSLQRVANDHIFKDHTEHVDDYPS